jgi:hypothetical protein
MQSGFRGAKHASGYDSRSRYCEIPDHLLGIDDTKLAEYRKTFQGVETLQKSLRELANDALDRISRSEDDVSKHLNRIFDKAVKANQEELLRAHDRKERGNPPGRHAERSTRQCPLWANSRHCTAYSIIN